MDGNKTHENWFDLTDRVRHLRVSNHGELAFVSGDGRLTRIGSLADDRIARQLADHLTSWVLWGDVRTA